MTTAMIYWMMFVACRRWFRRHLARAPLVGTAAVDQTSARQQLTRRPPRVGSRDAYTRQPLPQHPQGRQRSRRVWCVWDELQRRLPHAWIEISAQADVAAVALS
jgi:hypothetical protein